MCHNSRENVWSIIKKASLPKKSVRNKAQRDAFLSLGKEAKDSSEEPLSDFEQKRRISKNSIPHSKFLKILLRHVKAWVNS